MKQTKKNQTITQPEFSGFENKPVGATTTAPVLAAEGSELGGTPVQPVCVSSPAPTPNQPAKPPSAVVLVSPGGIFGDSGPHFNLDRFQRNLDSLPTDDERRSLEASVLSELAAIADGDVQIVNNRSGIILMERKAAATKEKKFPELASECFPGVPDRTMRYWMAGSRKFLAAQGIRVKPNGDHEYYKALAQEWNLARVAAALHQPKPPPKNLPEPGGSDADPAEPATVTDKPKKRKPSTVSLEAFRGGLNRVVTAFDRTIFHCRRLDPTALDQAEELLLRKAPESLLRPLFEAEITARRKALGLGPNGPDPSKTNDQPPSPSLGNGLAK